MVRFVNAFLSYGLLMLIIVALCGLGIFLGITLRKAKDASGQSQAGNDDARDGSEE